jgi:cleavage and polyadenylation specificity factor subunit 2
MLEWMDDNIVREFETVADGLKRQNGTAEGGKGKEAGPFDFKHLRLLERKVQVERILSQDVDGQEPKAKVILATDSTLEWGFSKDVLKKIANDARNLVILTEKPGSGADNKPSLAKTLWDWWKERKDGVATEQTSSGDQFEQVYVGGRQLELATAQRIALQGSELNLYQQWLATQRQLQATLQGTGSSALEASADAVDDASSDSSSESDESETEQQGKALNVSTTMGQASRKKVILTDEDLGITILLKKKGVYDFDVRGKKGRERMFPVAVRRRRNDEFGELIRPEDYVRAEEREEADGPETGLAVGENGDGVGKKRKWDDVGASNKSKLGPNKRPQLGRTTSGDDLDVAALSDGPAEDGLDDLEDDEESVVGPAKLAISTETVSVNLRIAFVDFSGLHDKRSLNMLIPLIQPRKLILVAGGEEETMSLSADCKKLLSAKLGTREENAVDVLTPSIGITVDASVDTNAWVVKLADPLVKRLKWQQVGGLGVVTVTGLLVSQTEDGLEATVDEDSANKRQKTEASSSTVAHSQSAVLPTLDVLPINLASAVRSAAPPLHVGDLRLADLRRAMQTSGHTAEFRGEGTLLIDGSVVVRKTVTGRIELETIGLPATNGPAALMGGTFYEVKRKIYEGLAVVTGA